MTLGRRDCPAVRFRSWKNSAADRRKSKGWHNETVSARGAERVSTRYHVGNAVVCNYVRKVQNYMIIDSSYSNVKDRQTDVRTDDLRQHNRRSAEGRAVINRVQARTDP